MVLSSDVSVALYMMHFSRHFPLREQLALILQLHGGVVLLELTFLFRTVLLCLEMRFAILGMELWLSFTLLLLQILCNR